MQQLETLTRLEIAVRQLDRAIRLYLEEADFVCAITLAGAAEVILGKLVAQSGGQPLVENYAAAIPKLAVAEEGVPVETKDAIEIQNAARNSLKHFQDGEPVRYDFRDEAYELIDRAIGNFILLTQNATPTMAEFHQRHARGG